MLNKKLALTALLASALAISACSKTETAAAPATNTAEAGANPVEARENLMKDWRRANETMKGMLENPSSFDAATFKQNADTIANSTADMWKHFEGDAAKGGDAQDAIWTDAAAFKAETEKFNAAAAALATAAATAQSAADVEKQFGEMASTCGSCHKVYKKD